MNLRECYLSMNADYESVIGRLGNEQLVCTFLQKCVDKDEYRQLQEAIEEKRWQEAFFHAHNIKGYGLNLSLTALTQTSSELCEALREGEPTGDIAGMLSNVKKDYEQLVCAVKSLSSCSAAAGEECL